MSVKQSVSNDGTNAAGEQSEPKLAPPGAGLPFIEWAVAKYIMLPQRLKSVTLEQAVQEFAKISRRIDELAQPLTEAQLSSRRLIPRLRGLEDSSRYWSVAMTMQHTVIVNNRLRGAVLALTNGKSLTTKSSTADVKPEADVDCSTIRTEFLETVESFQATVGRANFDKFPNATFAHPWFGELTAKQWVQFIPLHQKIHQTQIVEIIKRLEG